VAFKRPSKPTSRETAPKGSERIAVCERCQFEVAGSGNPREGVVWNLSVVGLYLVVQEDIPPLNAAVKVSIWLPGETRPVRAETEVVWCNPPSPFSGCGAKALRFPPGCGLKFVDISATELTRIQSRVETVTRNRPDLQRNPRRR
jgi:hypothetical protein